MRNLIYPCLLMGLFFAVESCSNKQYQALFEQKNSISDTSFQKNTAGFGTYRIKPQDVLQVRNLQNSKNIVDITPGGAAAAQGSISTQGDTFLVENDGTIAVTGLGAVRVAGLSRLEAQKLLDDLYRKTFLKAPIIEVQIINLKVTILGEIKSQGEFQLTKDRTTLIEIIGQAGGLTERADETNIKIIRGTQKNPQVAIIDLSNIQSINDPKAVLQSGDLIYIAKNKRAVRSDKIQNFSMVFQPIILLFNTVLIIVSLVRR
jgi:polysaccharide export outer membrane protein